MELRVISRQEVAATVEANKLNVDDSPRHNTHHHSLDELRNVLSDNTLCSHETRPQPWILLDDFLDIITASQGIAAPDVHTIVLPTRFLSIVEQVGQSGAAFQTLSSSHLEDLEDSFPKETSEGLRTALLFDSDKTRKYFARLSSSSLKDSRYQPHKYSRQIDRGSDPLISLSQIWQRIATSARAVQGIADLRAAGLPMKLFLLPWNERIKPQFEYRVFCAPGGGRLTAISQYRWFESWAHGGSEDKMRGVAQHVLDGALDVHSQLVRHPAIERLGLQRSGFTFDVAEVDDRIVLLELNDFGATTGCGSCLFHWISDARLLYGEAGDEVEFRVLGT